MQKNLLASSLLTASLLSPLALAQSTWYVDQAGTPPGTGSQADPFTDLQFAVDQATTLDGDEILVLPGVYSGGLDFAGKTLSVTSTGDPLFTVLIGSGSVVSATSGEGPGTSLEGFSIVGGSGTLNVSTTGILSVRGGGVLVVDSALLLRDCVLDSNSAGQGAGAFVEGGHLELVDCEVKNNVASSNNTGTVAGGGVACTRGLLTMSGTRVSGNFIDAPITASFSRAGAGVFVALVASGIQPSLRMNDCVIANNGIAQPGRGGGLFLASQDALIEDCTIQGNGIGAPSSGGSAGAGVYTVQNSEVILRRTRLVENGFGNTYGGGGYAGPGLLDTCELIGNEALIGGGVAGGSSSSFRPTLVHCLLEGNRARSTDNSLPRGGGASMADLVDCTLRLNTAFGVGGGAYGCSLRDCMIENNTAQADQGQPAQGGGIAGSIATDCWIADNTVNPATSQLTDGGGAAYGSSLTGCTLIANTVAPPGLGAATRDCSLDRCTVFGSDIPGGFGYTIDGPGLITNTIVWGNDTDFDIDPNGLLPEIRFSNIEEGVFPGPSNISVDPSFWSPANGDYRLRPVSPSIDAGDPQSPPDPDGSVADQGAFPFDPTYCGAPSNYCGAKINSLGCFASIGFQGFPSATGPDDFVLVASDLPTGQFGIPVWSASPAATPLAGGLLCVASPIVRGPVLTSGSMPTGACGGAPISFAFTQALMSAQGFFPGTRIYAQFWYRDPSHPDGTGQSLSDGLDFTICP